MVILDRKVTLDELMHIENTTYFNDMIKCVIDIELGRFAVNAELHTDLEELLLETGSEQKNLYGINILDDGEIEYDSLINPPRNRDAGYPRGGRYVCDPQAREKIVEVVETWLTK